MPLDQPTSENSESEGAPKSSLNYRDVRQDWPSQRWAGVFVGLAALSCCTILGLVLYWILENLQFYPGTPPPRIWRLPAAITVGVAAAWAAAFYQWRRVTPF